MKQKNYQRWSRPLLLTLLSIFMAFSGASSAWADPVTESFEDWSTSSVADGWLLINGATYGNSYSYDYVVSNDCTASEGSKTLWNSSHSTSGSTSSPMIVTPPMTGTLTFKYKKYNNSSSTKGYIDIFIYDEGKSAATGTAVWRAYPNNPSNEATSSYSTGSYSVGETPKRLAIYLSDVCIDQFSYTPYVDAGALAKPTDFTSTATTYNSATFSWTAGGTETAWQIAYDTDTDFDKDRVTPAPTDITAAELVEGKYTLIGLSESTTYYAYLRAKSGEDVSSWTSKISFTTPAQYPAPTALASSGETTSAATISWTAGSSETAWELSYSVNSDFSESTEVNVSTTPSKELTGLTANTTYYVKVRANYGGDNYSAWTDAITFKTLQVATDASNYSDDFETSNNWNLINGTQTNAWAWGTAAKKDGSKGLYISNDGGTTNAYSGSSTVYASQLFSFAAGDYIVSYDWLCKGEKGSYGSYDYLRVFLVPAATELTAGSGSFSYSGQPTGWISLDDAAALVNVSEWQHKSVNISIPSNTNYNVVFAWTSDGSGGDNPPAAIDNFSIRLNDTPNPTSLAVTDITAHAGTLGWTSTDNTWEVYHSTSSATPAVDQTPTASPNTNSYTFTGLDAETKYYVWVRSVSKTNASWKSDWVGTNFTTDVAAVAPTGLTASSITATGATLNWTAGAGETKWDLVYGTVNDAESLSNTKEEINTTPTKVLTGLTAETTYYAFVRAKKGEEVSSWVSISFFPTATVQLTVNDGEATNDFAPIYGYYADGVRPHSQFIIPSTEITAIDGGQISKVTFYASQPSITWTGSYTPTFKVYMKEVAETEFASAAFVDWATLSEVYSGVLSVSDNKMVVTLDTPFEYNGGNLLIGFNETAKGGYATSTWIGVSTGTNTVVGQNEYASALEFKQFLPKTTFTYLPVTGAKMQINKTAIDFGSVTSLPQNETFTISNSKGKADLTNIAVNITGTNAAAYSVSALPRTTITTTGETAADIELTVTFNPTAGGTYNDATITINADDQEEKTIALTGTYVANPVMGVFNDSEATDAATTGETINFGYVEAAPVYTYYIKNTGAGTLVVAVTNGGFTVSPANASLAAGEQQAFTITPNVANADATVTFTGTNGSEAIGTFTVTLQGTVMPLTTTFFEGFNYADKEATTTELNGWEIENNTNNLEFKDGKLLYQSQLTESAYVITPKLRVAGTDDVMSFSAYVRYLNAAQKVVISYSADKVNWTEATTKAGDTDFDAVETLKSFQLNGIPEGSYYFKIELADAAVGYFYGFSTSHPAAVALNESSTPSLEDNVVRDVTLTRNFIAGWNTICLPFAVAAADMESKFGAGVKLYDCTGFSENVLSFEQVNTGIVAGKPYLIYVANAIADPITFWNATISATAPVNTVLSGVTFHGTFAPIAAGDLTGMYGISKNGRIAKADKETSMKGFRGYLEGSLSSARISIFDETTGISRIYDANEVFGKDAKVYNLSGQKVENANKGLYIVNGRKVVVK